MLTRSLHESRRWSRTPVLGVPLVVWMLGVALGVVLLGPALGGGSLLNLDLNVLDRVHMPTGMWGLGPELPRRVPLGALLSWCAWLIGGEATGKLLMLGSITVAFAGTHRLSVRALDRTDPSDIPSGAHRAMLALGTATLWAAGPFMLTRLAIGFWPIPVTMAFLPWSIPSLTSAEPGRRRILLWSALFALAGVAGALAGGAYLLVACCRRSAVRTIRDRLGDLGVWVLGQMIWIVPSVVVMTTSTGRTLADSAPFATDVDGIGGLGRLMLGMGFWNRGFQLGLTQPVLASVVGSVLLVLAILGTQQLPRPWRSPIVIVGVSALALALASSIPGVDSVFRTITDNPIGASLREPHRYLFPFLLWIALSAPLGAVVAARRVGAGLGGALMALPLVAAIVVIAPSAWGLEHQVRPVTIPAAWSEARRAIDRDPGPVLVLPWHQYFTADVADGRLTLSPFPSFIGGDVISSSNPNIADRPLQESADGREIVGAEIARAAGTGQPVDDQLRAIGVRWVALVHDVDWRTLQPALDADADLVPVVESTSLTLYRVDGWTGMVTLADGSAVPSTELIPPWWEVDGSPEAVMHRPFQRGWLRGTDSATEGPDGQIALPAGSGPVWFWPAVPVLLTELLWSVAVLLVLIRSRRRGRDQEHTPDGNPQDPLIASCETP